VERARIIRPGSAWLVAAAPVCDLDLMTNVAIAFPRSPWHLANAAYDLQELSGGRFRLGLGTQIKAHVEKRFGGEFGRPVAHMREWVLAIKAIWRCWNEGERLDFEGEIYQHTLMTPMFSPGPNPFGNPKIYVAGVGPRMTEVAAEVADGFFTHPFHTAKSWEATTLPALVPLIMPIRPEAKIATLAGPPRARPAQAKAKFTK